MFFDLCIGQFTRNPLTSPVGFKNRDADGAGNSARIRVNDVLNRPCREEYGLAYIRLTILAEDINQESEEWISSKFS
ncbi:hypothetical protein BOQ54_04695 [Chelatococcus daeguensis]|uniref:Uncharacterized protein n=1 Tax=Chelatococcus daeguensis TaxID=444444 RepID=A0AAC9JPD3_9HYPH|nr:hypothetical protein BOQ54_04695 [Chelatococcus daeguensis]